MRHFTKTLILSTAVGLVLATGALAGDNNTVYLEQDGDSNVSSVKQNGGSNNDIGTVGDPVTQDGEGNSFSFTNELSGGGSNNDIVKAEQVGDDNNLNVQSWNIGNNNLVQDIQQIGDLNRASLGFNGSDDGIVGTVLQQGNRNFLTIDVQGLAGHGSTGNVVTLVNMIGSNNGWSMVNDNNKGIRIRQRGSSNVIDEASIFGSNNNASGTSPGITIWQYGSSNGQGSVGESTAINWGTLSAIDVFQDGSFNDFYITQGTIGVPGVNNTAAATQIGLDNDVTIVQEGSDQDATVTQTGDDNHVNAKQLGGNNTLVATITGDDNGIGVFTGARLALANGKGLVSGDLFQDGMSNNLDLTITSSNLNNFAFLQDGDGNEIDGDVSGGNGNEAVVAQVGNNNTSDFSQIGGGNLLNVSQ